jgi:hypothetical protein
LGRLASIGLGLALALRPDSLWACAACFGKSDSALAAGLNWGILSLLAVVLAVLGGIAAFFVQVARRGALTDEPSTPPATSEIPQQNP